MTTIQKSGLTQTIPQFYVGQSIFITGGTGFLGKVLIEKILRSCPDVKEVFVLMRPKKNIAIDARLKLMLELPLYDKVRKERPGFHEKIIPVQGDVALEGLGLGPVERQFIQERVSIVFHVAANIRFDDSLKQAVFTNTRSTRDICILAHGMKKLVALVHVSSTYAHTEKPEVDEIIYPPVTDWRKIITIVENLDDSILRPMTPKLLGFMLNTYTFTKRLAEQVIADYSKDLPIVLCRPSIVINALHEPISGWLDNFNGPVGLMIGGGKGVVKIALVDPNMAGDYIPVDVTIKAILISAYKRGLETVTENPKPLVFNAASQAVTRITLKSMVRRSLNLVWKDPIEDIVWYPQVYMTPYRFIYYILFFLLHVIPAFIMDRLLELNGKKPILMKLQRKIYVSNCTLAYFTMNYWKFHSNTFLALLTDILPVDKEVFSADFRTLDLHAFLTDALAAAKIYLLKQKTTTSERAIRHNNRMWWADRIFKVWLLCVLAWILHMLGTFAYLGDVIYSIMTGSFTL